MGHVAHRTAVGTRGAARIVACGITVHAPAVVDATLHRDIGRVLRELNGLQFHLNLDQLLDIGQQAGVVFAAHKAHRQAGRAGAPGAANAVHIVFGVERQVKVKDCGHIFDVQATRGHVGADQQIDLAALEGFERLEPLVLALVAVQCGGFKAFALQRARQAGTTELAVDKHKGLLHAARFQYLVQGRAFVVFAHTVKALLDG